jgi:hypothetical protein
MSSLSCPKASLTVYRPRKPEKTVLFGVIKKYFTTWSKKSEELFLFSLRKNLKNIFNAVSWHMVSLMRIAKIASMIF